MSNLSNGFFQQPPSDLVNGAIGNVSGILPSSLLAGSLWDYTQVGTSDIAEVQYTRVYVPGSKTITKMAYRQVSGGGATRHVRMGIYAQTDPANEDSVPSTKVAETAEITTTGLDLTTVEEALTAPYVFPAAGYYWLAFVTDSADLVFATSEMYGPDFLAVRRGPGSGSTLPASPGIIVNPSSAAVFVLALEA